MFKNCLGKFRQKDYGKYNLEIENQFNKRECMRDIGNLLVNQVF